MLTITAEASDRITKVVEGHGEYTGLRVALKDAGCSGYMYEMDFKAGPEAGEQVLEQGGALVFVPTQQADQLTGSTLSWMDDVFESGFKIANPRATRVCGCGESFNLKTSR